jgi:hypothetical protein
MSLVNTAKIKCECGKEVVLTYGWVGMGNEKPLPGDATCSCGKKHTCGTSGPTDEQRGARRPQMNHRLGHIYKPFGKNPRKENAGMKLFIFDPSEWGEYYTVMAKDAETALESVKGWMEERALENIEDQLLAPHYLSELEKWKDATLDNLPDKYFIKEFSENQVIQGEYS